VSAGEKQMEVTYVPEPDLAFGYRQVSDHPKDGLFLYGPHNGPVRSKEISVGVIGTKEGLTYFRNWAIKLGGFISIPPKGKMDKEHRLHLSNFPGIEEAFGLMLSPGEFVERTIDLNALDEATRTVNQTRPYARRWISLSGRSSTSTGTRNAGWISGCLSFPRSSLSAANRSHGGSVWS
jgi:hypothetical protein